MADTRTAGKVTLALLGAAVVLLAVQTLALVSMRSALDEAERARRELVAAREGELREAAGRLDAAASRLAAALENQGRRNADPISEFLEAGLLLSRSGDATTRCAAARILKGIQDERAEARLVEMAKKDPSQYARNEAVAGLAEAGYAEIGDILLEAWDRGGMDESSRRQYVRRLKQAGNQTACKLLLYIIHHDPSRDVIREATEDLVEIATRRDVAILGKTVDALRAKPRERSGGSLRIAVEALGKMDDMRATEHLVPCLSHEDAEVACEAARALGRLRDPLAARPLVEALERKGLRGAVEEIFKKDYPGVRRDDGGAFVPVDDDEMKRLLAEREERIERRLDEIRKLDEAVDVF